MYYKNEIVPFVGVNSALEEFINWLPEKCLLTSHNGKSFDSKILVHQVKNTGEKLFEIFSDKLGGFVDTLPFFRAKFPERKSFSQTSLACDLLSNCLTENSHNALTDCRILRALVQKYCKSSKCLENFSFDLKFVLDNLEYFSVKQACLQSLQVLINRKIVSKGIVDKIAGSGLNLGHLNISFRRSGKDGIKNLLTEKTASGKPRVTNSKLIVDKLIDYFEKIEK